MEESNGSFALLFGPLFILWLAIIVVYVVSWWKIFTKAGQPGWAAIIPIYNIVVLLQVVEKPLWFVILCLIPYVNAVMAILLCYWLAKSFGKGVGFTLGLIFLGIIFYPILGFGSSEYQGGTAEVQAPPVQE